MTDTTRLTRRRGTTRIPVADDFYHHVNSTWLAANPVPPEYPMWGAYIELDHNNKELRADCSRRRRLRVPMATSSPASSATSTPRGWTKPASQRPEFEPLRPYLDRIDAIESVEDLRTLNLEFHRSGSGALFGIGVEADFENAEVYLAYLGQAGLGLPTRDYYLDDDERSVALRGAYTAHITTQFRNLGASDEAAAAVAATILAFERRLAEVSLSREQQRRPEDHDEPLRGLDAGRAHARLPPWHVTCARSASPATP